MTLNKLMISLFMINIIIKTVIQETSEDDNKSASKKNESGLYKVPQSSVRSKMNKYA